MSKTIIKWDSLENNPKELFHKNIEIKFPKSVLILAVSGLLPRAGTDTAPEPEPPEFTCS